MARGLKIPKLKDMSLNKKITKHLNVPTVYMPLVNQNDTNVTILVKKGDYVHKGDVIARRKGKMKIPIHSSVSGKVISFEEKYYINGDLVKCAVIENDFKESINTKKTNRKVINDFSKDEFIEKLKNMGIIGMGGSGFPTYLKYSSNNNLKTLIINAVECEPYITSDYTIILEKCEEILEAIDAIMEINGISEGIIAIKKGNNKLRDIVNNYIGTYLKIRIVEVPNLYPMGWERSLIKQVKGVDYVKLPSEKGIVVNNISTIYAIYEALKFDKPLIERIVTITGEMIKEPQNVLVKIGTPASEIIKHIGGYKRFKEIKFVAGGPMMGTSIKNEELVVSGNLNCILVIKDLDEVAAIECLRCGKCIEVCPAKIAPVLIKDKLKQTEELKELRPERCIECGLCSYICPSKINVRLCVVKAKKTLIESEV